MSKTKQKMTMVSRPSDEEIAERIAERQSEDFARLHQARDLAREVFHSGAREAQPSVEEVLGVNALLCEEMLQGDSNLVRNHLRRAQSVTESVLGDKATSEAVIDVAQHLLADDDAEAHVAKAATEARRLFGDKFTADSFLAVYFLVYGPDEDEE